MSNFRIEFSNPWLLLLLIPAVALAFCAASALAYWMFRGRGFTVPGLTVPWLTPACIVLGAFALFVCL